ncbi:GNAT family N-acetyltransferase [Conexibacter sp. CPCC 206217]|uniref:GNAT family N-acetyltransferase n=1 Tax=Conexibacter sp. CPCC 206217 TaxID=3064574 RepID=UPI00271A884B|nr:GNAT family protein [Conexibacter sp. CPCC 206217]MDO8211212.1 GNAT family protein [Conexibacter sp. CPCC 206217]
METIGGRLVRLRRVTVADVPWLRELLAEPEVARWWGEQEDDLHALVRLEPGETSYAIELLGGGGARPVGLIQSWEEPEPMYRHAGIDIALHPSHHGRGIGTDALVALARHLLGARGHHRLTIDPAAANTRAIGVYTRIGFRPVGVMRRYERAPDGSWRDGLLMDLLAGELVDPGRG